jgi:hypothetical protein
VSALSRQKEVWGLINWTATLSYRLTMLAPDGGQGSIRSVFIDGIPS